MSALRAIAFELLDWDKLPGPQRGEVMDQLVQELKPHQMWLTAQGRQYVGLTHRERPKTVSHWMLRTKRVKESAHTGSLRQVCRKALDTIEPSNPGGNDAPRD